MSHTPYLINNNIFSNRINDLPYQPFCLRFRFSLIDYVSCSEFKPTKHLSRLMVWLRIKVIIVPDNMFIWRKRNTWLLWNTCEWFMYNTYKYYLSRKCDSSIKSFFRWEWTNDHIVSLINSWYRNTNRQRNSILK